VPACRVYIECGVKRVVSANGLIKGKLTPYPPGFSLDEATTATTAKFWRPSPLFISTQV
jgi:hypothetical protein